MCTWQILKNKIQIFKKYIIIIIIIIYFIFLQQAEVSPRLRAS